MFTLFQSKLLKKNTPRGICPKPSRPASSRESEPSRKPLSDPFCRPFPAEAHRPSRSTHSRCSCGTLELVAKRQGKKRSQIERREIPNYSLQDWQHYSNFLILMFFSFFWKIFEYLGNSLTFGNYRGFPGLPAKFLRFEKERTAGQALLFPN